MAKDSGPTSLSGFSEADLPLDAGRVYHLQLAPEELADTIITVGDPARVPMVSHYFSHIDVKRSHREFVTHTGEMNGQRVSVIATGIGTDNIDIVLNECDILANVDVATRQAKPFPRSLHFLRLGTAGTLQADVPLDTPVVATAALGFDSLMHHYQYAPGSLGQALLATWQECSEAATLPAYVSEASSTLLQRFQGVGQQGFTATCPGFYGPQGRQLRGLLVCDTLLDSLRCLSAHDQSMLVFEMETAGLYGLASVLGHEAVSFSTVVAQRATGKFTTRLKKSVEDLIQVGLAHMIGEA